MGKKHGTPREYIFDVSMSNAELYERLPDNDGALLLFINIKARQSHMHTIVE